MAHDSPLYPPPPARVPSNLTRPGFGYRLRLALVLAALLLFLGFYVALVLISLLVLIAAIAPTLFFPMTIPNSIAAQIAIVVFRVGVCLAVGMFFAYLVKGFLKRQPDDTSSWLPVDAADRPELFAFLGQLCREIGCDRPPRPVLRLYPKASSKLVRAALSAGGYSSK